MAIEQTFAIIKPDAVEAKNAGKIIDMIEGHGFEILRMQKGQLTPELAEIFYEEHAGKPFFGELVEFISSSPVIIMALQKENAIAEWRKLMGATDPKKADKGTIRSLYASSVGKNSVHGSDSAESAQRELGLFFSDAIETEVE